MKAFKRILLGLVSLLICNVDFPQTTEFDTQPKFQANSETEEQIDKSMFQGYVEISQYDVNFNKSGFENNVLLPLKGLISDEEYESYEKQCSYLESTAKAMTEFAQQGEGVIKSDGTFLPSKDVTSSIVPFSNVTETVKGIATEYPEIEESDFQWLTKVLTESFFRNFYWNFWTGFDILYGPAGTSTMGLIGMIINFTNFYTSLKGNLDLNHTTYEILTQGLLGNPTLFESDLKKIGDYILLNADEIRMSLASDTLSVIADEFVGRFSFFVSAAFCLSGIISLLKKHPSYWIVKIILNVLGYYLPSFLIGTVMFFDGFRSYDCRAVITPLGSNYTIIE